MEAPLSFHVAGGDIYLGRTHLDRPMALSLRAIFAQEILAAEACGDRAAYTRALHLIASIEAALQRQREWLGDKHRIVREHP